MPRAPLLCKTKGMIFLKPGEISLNGTLLGISSIMAHSNFMKKTLVSALVCAFMALPATAQNLLEDPVQADVLEGWVKADGSRMAALRLKLAPGWKTYWRAPGDAGIPPSFDWSRSKNMHSVSISWPTPRVFDQNGMRSVGYQDTLVIPLSIQPSSNDEPVRLRVRMDLGVCSDVCIPHKLEFDTVIDSVDTRPTPAIAAALAARPYSASEAGVASSECSVRPTPDGLELEARISMPSAGKPEHVVIEPQAGDIWVSEARTKRSGNTIVATSELIHVDGGPIALDRSNVRITVLGSQHGVDILGCSPG